MIISIRLCSILLITLALSFNYSHSQVKTMSNQDSPNIYISCNYCSGDFLRKSLPFMNFVRDRKDADIFVQFYDNDNGGGGVNHTIDFTGENKFAGLNDTLHYSTNPTMTEDERRDKMLSYLKMGLLRYILRTPLVEKAEVTYNFKSDSNETKQDDWDSWVFQIGAQAYFSGQSSYNSLSAWGDISASRTTEDLITGIDLSNSYNQDAFNYDDLKITSISRSFSSSAWCIFSIDNHWSAGVWAHYSNSSYSNLKLSLSAQPGIEYNIFPYSDYTRRQLRINYKIGPAYKKYIDTTIYEKLKDTLIAQSLSATFEYILPWGNFSCSVSGDSYLHDLSKNQFSVYANSSLKIYKGLSINFYISYASIHNQLNLSKAGATRDEVLLRRKQLETQYNFSGSFGISYTFGSIYDNVVNPRFGG
jgi:hypothetical protein